uniref:Acetylglutamate kinase n=1 Tax=Thuretia quercifolia TaxID=189650 RepID=A0A1Z1MKN1_9FLOR|nr:acetylglutamate kinase [Thuretia quercifolia]ARW66496.1 acetylglutamate kinase [Thuretia quercifolia]
MNILNVSEFLPFVQKYFGHIIVIKYGGAAMQNTVLQSKVIKNICLLHSLGLKVILVHGGGPFINEWLCKLNITPKFHKGIRVTDHDTMEIVEMVLAGQINKQLVSLFSQNFTQSIGLCGKDSNLIVASPLFDDPNNLVGQVQSININLLNLLLENRYIPVIASIGLGSNNKTYNINADTVAGSIAGSLKAHTLVLLTDTPGIMLDIKNPLTLLKSLDLERVQQLKNNSIISGGMIPKVECCVKALQAGVKSTHIIDGRVSDSLLYELFTSSRIGSQILL